MMDKTTEDLRQANRVLQNILSSQNEMLEEKITIIKAQNRKIKALGDHIWKLLRKIRMLQMMLGN